MATRPRIRRTVLGSARTICAVVALGLVGACTGGIRAADLVVVSTTQPSAPAEAAPAQDARGHGSVSAVVEPPEVFPAPPPDPVELALDRLGLEEKVGQLIMAAVWGTDAVAVAPRDHAENQAIGRASTPAEMVAAHGLGGVLYLSRNVVDGPQAGAFSDGLQSAAAPTGIGLLIAVDQEGGRVNRIGVGATRFPAARELAGDGAAVRSAAATTAAEMRAMGINVVLAPVADVTDSDAGVIGDRSYGGDPELVAAMVAAAVDGLQAGDGTAAGAAGAVKHWPGHGATDTDSHFALPVIGVDDTTWRAREQLPFHAAIEAGVHVVLVGHLALPALDPTGEPATVSPVLIEGLLRGEMGFDGVVMTDALDMGAVAGYPMGELAVRAVLAGADILLAPPDVVVVRDAVVAAVAEGRISVERLDASVERVLRLKQTLGLPVS